MFMWKLQIKLLKYLPNFDIMNQIGDHIQWQSYCFLISHDEFSSSFKNLD